jgi:hypothetical protein
MSVWNPRACRVHSQPPRTNSWPVWERRSEWLSNHWGCDLNLGGLGRNHGSGNGGGLTAVKLTLSYRSVGSCDDRFKWVGQGSGFVDGLSDEACAACVRWLCGATAHWRHCNVHLVEGFVPFSVSRSFCCCSVVAPLSGRVSILGFEGEEEEDWPWRRGGSCWRVRCWASRRLWRSCCFDSGIQTSTL